MARKRARKKHSVKATVHIFELARAGSSLNLEIFASKEKIGTLILGSGSLFWFGKKTAQA